MADLCTVTTPAPTTIGKGQATALVSWDSGFGPEWTAKLQALRAVLTQEAGKRTDPYVPLKSGVLAGSVALASDFAAGLLIYSTPYAAAQYYDTSDTRSYDPLRGGHWFERMKADNMAYLTTFAERAVKTL